MITSLVVPMYNAEQYIENCLDSIMAMTLPPDQVIVVDDRSTDSSLNVLGRYLSTHPGLPVEVIRLEHNVGVSVARNRGVAAADGDFVGFVDADDTVMPAMLELLTEAAAQHDDIDLVMARHLVIRGDGGAVVEARTPATRGTVTGPGAFTAMCRGELASSVCFGLIRRTLLLDHAFRPGVRFEDFIFLSEALPMARRVALVDAPVYRYHRRSGTETGGLNPSVRDLMVGLASAEASLGRLSDQGLARYLRARLRLTLNLAMGQQAIAFGDGSDLAASIIAESRSGISWPTIAHAFRRGDLLLSTRAALFRCGPQAYGTVFRGARALRWRLASWGSSGQPQRIRSGT